MDTAPPPLSDELASALDWWRDAGVDCEFTDDATAWLGAEGSLPTHNVKSQTNSAPPEPAHTQSALLAPEIERVDLLGPSPPETLEAFQAFWMEAPGLDAIGPRGRVPPRGVVNAKLMVLTADPEENDRERLLSGPQGDLLAKMLRAMGISEDETYLASALPRHTPMADTDAIGASGMDAVTAHHITLAAPKAVLVIGLNILPLLGPNPPKEPASLREINLTRSSVPVLLTDGLDSLMTMPRLKARFWRRWIEWSAKVL